MTRMPRTVVSLSGGVGGAKLAHGLAQIVPAEELLIVANTGDDFTHLGLYISPDVDTLIYTLAGIADPERGWGCAAETWSFMTALDALGGPTWFRLGDRDLATHVLRTARLSAGATLSGVTRELSMQLGVGARLTPMSDDPVHTVLHTDEGALAFQEYFVHRQCRPAVHRIEFIGAADAQPAASLSATMQADAACAVILCPSNPYLSIDPILAVPGIRSWLAATAAAVIAVSPIVGGEALKGPAAKLLCELAGSSSALSVARHYAAFLDMFVLDRRDVELSGQIEALGIDVVVTDTIMRNNEDRRRLAGELIEWVARKDLHRD